MIGNKKLCKSTQETINMGIDQSNNVINSQKMITITQHENKIITNYRCDDPISHVMMPPTTPHK